MLRTSISAINAKDNKMDTTVLMSNAGQLWAKPEYCKWKELDCAICEYHDGRHCILNESHIKLLEEILRRLEK
jgi:hypothetical protein